MLRGLHISMSSFSDSLLYEHVGRSGTAEHSQLYRQIGTSVLQTMSVRITFSETISSLYGSGIQPNSPFSVPLSRTHWHHGLLLCSQNLLCATQMPELVCSTLMIMIGGFQRLVVEPTVIFSLAVLV